VTRPADIALIVDQKWRDLPGMAALAAWLELKHGLPVVLLPYTRWREVLVRHRPRAIAVTHMNGTRSRAIADAARSFGTKLVVIQTEGRPNNSETMEYAVGRGTDPRGVDLWFTWSDTVRAFMLERQLLAPERIVTAGVARFDYYREPFRALNETRESMARRYGLDPSRPIVTLATNFTNTKFYKANQEFLASDWKDLGLSHFKAYADPHDWARRDWETREQTLGIARALLRARPHVQLVLKPHPAEEHDRYETFASEVNAERNGDRAVAFVGLEYIWNVLSMSDVHVHRLCTTGVEAWLLGLPSIDLHVADYHGWSLTLGGSAAEAVAGNDLVSSADALIERVDHYVRGGRISREQQQARDRYIERWLHVVDGARSEAHADAIAGLVAGMPSRRRATLAEAVRVGVGAFVRSLRQPARRDAERSVDRIGQVDPRITSDDAAYWMARVRPVVEASLGAAQSRTGAAR
jgi:surface carbohydrate biosynthesis protein